MKGCCDAVMEFCLFVCLFDYVINSFILSICLCVCLFIYFVSLMGFSSFTFYEMDRIKG